MEESIFSTIALYAGLILAGIAAFYKFFLSGSKPVIVTPPEADKKAAEDSKVQAENIKKETEAVKTDLNNTIAASDARESAAEKDFDKAESSIKSDDLDKIKKYLKSEGYNVNEIYPE